MKPTVLVVGGGIAGVRAGLELLLQGFKPCLLAQGSSFLEHAEAMEKLFPPNEHAACAMQPLRQVLTSNLNATILASARIVSLQGSPGDFKVDLLREAAGTSGKTSQVQLSVGAVIVAVESETERRTLLGKLGVALDKEKTPSLPSHAHPCHTARAGVFLCGATPAKQELGRLVVQACAAAAQTAALLAPARCSPVITRVDRRPGPLRLRMGPRLQSSSMAGINRSLRRSIWVRSVSTRARFLMWSMLK